MIHPLSGVMKKRLMMIDHTLTDDKFLLQEIDLSLQTSTSLKSVRLKTSASNLGCPQKLKQIAMALAT